MSEIWDIPRRSGHAFARHNVNAGGQRDPLGTAAQLAFIASNIASPHGPLDSGCDLQLKQLHCGKPPTSEEANAATRRLRSR
jgi:hypothetical protein